MYPSMTEAADRGLLVVGLVASTGGLDALTQVLAPLPADFPAAIVALQHIRPEHPSRLAEILARHTALCVQPARDGDRLRVRAGPGRPTGPPHPGLPGSDDRAHRLRAAPAVTALGGSAVDLDGAQLRARAVAVVLSGAGHDGTTGAAAVKRLGGLVLAQDQASSRDFGMPGSAIAFDEIVDRVLALARIGPALKEMVSA